jgi:GNAT superfamily N-acetyltransferase
MITVSKLALNFPDEGNSLLIVAQDEQQHLLGTVTLKIRSPKSGPKAGYFQALFVHPKHRKMGIGRILLAECEDRALAAACHMLTAYVKPGNVEAHAFYLKCGYSFGYVWDDGDVGLVKHLAEYVPALPAKESAA